jgi:putative inorganic carbon (hco3(-)) transporter
MDEAKFKYTHLFYPLFIGILLGLLVHFCGLKLTAVSILFFLSISLSIRKPYLCFALLFLMAPFEFYANITFLTLTSNEIILIGLIIGFSLNKLINKDYINLRIIILFLPFLLIQVLSLTKAVDIGAGIKQFIRWFEFFIVFFITFNSFKTKDEFVKVLKYLIIAAIPISLYGIYQSLVGFGGFMSELIPMSPEEMRLNMLFGTFIRAHSILVQANHLGAYLVLVIPLSFAISFALKGKSNYFWIQSSLIFKHIDKIVRIVFFITLFLTMSRSSWIALISSFFIISILSWISRVIETKEIEKTHSQGFFRSRKILMSTIIIITIMIVFIAIMLPQILSRIGSFGNLENDLASNKRIDFLKVGTAIIRDNPILGVGIGNYTSISSKYAPKEMDPIGSRIHLHNLYLQITVETGLIGLLAFMFYIFCIFTSMTKYLFESLLIENRLVKLVMIATLAFLIQNFADIFFVKGIHLIFAGLVGGMLGVSRRYFKI